jgi:hypothetical protein
MKASKAIGLATLVALNVITIATTIFGKKDIGTGIAIGACMLLMLSGAAISIIVGCCARFWGKNYASRWFGSALILSITVNVGFLSIFVVRWFANQPMTIDLRSDPLSALFWLSVLPLSLVLSSCLYFLESRAVRLREDSSRQIV